MTALTAGVVMLFMMVAVLLLLTLGLLRRVRLLQSGVRPVIGNNLIGKPVPHFQIQSTGGLTVTDKAIGLGQSWLLFVAVGCEACAEIEAALLAAPPTEALFFFVDGSPKDPEATELADLLSEIGTASYVTSAGPVAESFDILGYPSLFRVESGKIASFGTRLGDVQLVPAGT